jgi:ATP-dependent protease HslVU (ClpYQ) peptidase subunit
LSTITVARFDGRLAIAADALTTFEETRLPATHDAAPDKIFAVGDAYVGIVGYTAHHLVFQDAFAQLGDDLDLSSRAGVFETFRALHPILKEEYYLLPESGEDGDPYETTHATLLIASPGGLFGVYDMREVHAFSRFWAMGSGFAYALGAMEACYGDLSARDLAVRGVEVGCTFDRSSGPPVQVFEVEEAL